jgi:hypothetical protein
MFKSISQSIYKVKCDFCQAMVTQDFYVQKNGSEFIYSNDNKNAPFSCGYYKRNVWLAKVKMFFCRETLSSTKDDSKDSQLHDLYGYRYIK